MAVTDFNPPFGNVNIFITFTPPSNTVTVTVSPTTIGEDITLPPVDIILCSWPVSALNTLIVLPEPNCTVKIFLFIISNIIYKLKHVRVGFMGSKVHCIRNSFVFA